MIAVSILSTMNNIQLCEKYFYSGGCVCGVCVLYDIFESICILYKFLFTSSCPATPHFPPRTWVTFPIVSSSLAVRIQVSPTERKKSNTTKSKMNEFAGLSALLRVLRTDVPTKRMDLFSISPFLLFII